MPEFPEAQRRRNRMQNRISPNRGLHSAVKGEKRSQQAADSKPGDLGDASRQHGHRRNRNIEHGVTG